MTGQDLDPIRYNIRLHERQLKRAGFTEKECLFLHLISIETGRIEKIAQKSENSGHTVRNHLVDVKKKINQLAGEDSNIHRSGWMKFLLLHGLAHLEVITNEKETAQTPNDALLNWIELLSL